MSKREKNPKITRKKISRKIIYKIKQHLIENYLTWLNQTKSLKEHDPYNALKNLNIT